MNKEQIKKTILEKIDWKDLDEIIAIAQAKRIWRISNWFSIWWNSNVNKDNSKNSKRIKE